MKRHLLIIIALFPALSCFAADYMWVGAGVQTPKHGNGAPVVEFGGQWRWWYMGVNIAAYKSFPDNFSVAAISLGATPLNLLSRKIHRSGVVVSTGVAFTLLTVAAKTVNYGGYTYWDPYYEPETDNEFHALGEVLVRVPFLTVGRRWSDWPHRLYIQARGFGSPVEDDMSRAFTGFSITLGWQGRSGW